MKPGRYNTTGILKRLERDGYIHESDLVWLEKRAHKLEQALDCLDDNEGHADAYELAAIEMALPSLFNPCTGEAHSNAFIDNCMMCAPRWGHVINYDKVLRKLTKGEAELLAAARGGARVPATLGCTSDREARNLRYLGFVEERRNYVDRRDEIEITAAGMEHLRRTGMVK